ncbi:ent-kaurenoic acid oxidase 2 [Senna tora]|uniref:Ent-kaurenoic acid oxidase 2 n=1 Tax=Senna tora TaxID=362788 RepID=A0A834SMB7_9FABA|nr:ent-kaurenoic acid oxidase 2 [Senna tora]
MELTVREWVGVVLGGLPLLGLVLWWWNELWYAVPLMRANKRLPPGHMGLPFIGDMLAFLFYFKLLRRPDEYINAKRRKYVI